MNEDTKPVKIISTKKMLNQCFDKIQAQKVQIDELEREVERYRKALLQLSDYAEHIPEISRGYIVNKCTNELITPVNQKP